MLLGESQMNHLPNLPPAMFVCGKRPLSIRNQGVNPFAALAFAVGVAVLLGASVAQAASGFFKESPLLAEKVEAGELPPVAERLPRNPVLVDPVERLGRSANRSPRTILCSGMRTF